MIPENKFPKTYTEIGIEELNEVLLRLSKSMGWKEVFYTVARFQKKEYPETSYKIIKP